MGKRQERREQAIALAQAGLAQHQASQAAEATERREEQLGSAEQILGTEAQFSGTPIDPAARAWEGRYELDTDLFQQQRVISQNLNPSQQAALSGGPYGEGVAFNEANPYHVRLRDEWQEQHGYEQGWTDAQGNFVPPGTPGATATNMQGVSGVPGGTFTDPYRPEYLNPGVGGEYGIKMILGDANHLLDQAQEAYARGDIEAAEGLKAQAEQVIAGVRLPGGAAPLDQIITMAGGELTPEEAALAQLQSPIAQNVGRLVQRGQAYLDPYSEESLRFKRSLTEGAETAIESGETYALRELGRQERGAEATRRRSARSMGGARSFMGEQALAERSSERLGMARANIELETSTRLAELRSSTDAYFNSFSLDFAANTSQMGQAFLQNQAGIRDGFQAMMSNLTMGAAQFADNLSDRAYRAYTEFSLIPPGPSTGEMIVGGLSSVIGGAAGSYAGGAAGGG